MKFLILGDTHGYWSHLNSTIGKAISENLDITHIVQVGDFGYGWPHGKPFKINPTHFTEQTLEVYNKATKLFLDGNHDNFDQLEKDNGEWQPEWTYMPRGSILEVDGYRVLFFGGASSIDKQWRKPHVSWWPQESITYEQVRNTLEKVEGPIDAVFSHEHPAAIPYSDKYKQNFGQGDKDLLEVIRKHYNPNFWFFGHHHAADHGIVYGTEWVCCPIIESLAYTIWDGEQIIRHKHHLSDIWKQLD